MRTDHVGNENTRVFRDVAEVGARLKKLEDVLGTYTKSRVALIYDWQNRWALDRTQAFRLADKKVHKTLCDHYYPLWKRGINTEVIGEDDDFSCYDLIIAPQLYVTSDKMINKIEEYVRNGGTFLGTYMLGMVNESDRCHLGGFPEGKLKDVFGIRNEEIDTLYPGESNSIVLDGVKYKTVDYSRTDGENVYVFLQNYTTREQSTAITRNRITADDKREVSGEITLTPFETLILSRKIGD